MGIVMFRVKADLKWKFNPLFLSLSSGAGPYAGPYVLSTQYVV